DAHTPEMRVQITAPEGEALNLGQLLASGGRIGMYAGLVRQGGVASADTAVVGENGKIVFKATKSVRLEPGSRTTANGPTGGSISVTSDTGTAVVAGVVEANGTAGKGGTVEVAAPQGVTVEPTARISANGTEGGTVTLAPTAQLTASGGQGLGVVSVKGDAGVTLAAGSVAQASGAAGGTVSVQA